MRVSLGDTPIVELPAWRPNSAQNIAAGYFNVDPNYTEPVPELCRDASCMMTGKLPSINFETWFANNQSAVLTLALVLVIAANVQRNR